MARISTYALDSDLIGSDKWIGTSANSSVANETKNFSLNAVANFLNKKGVVESQALRYTYQNKLVAEDRNIATISFPTPVGDAVNFSSISSWMLSTFALPITGVVGKDVHEFYTAPLIGSTVLVTNAENPTNWAIYSWNSSTQNVLEPTFYDIGLTFISGSGKIIDGQDYFISLFSYVSLSGLGTGLLNVSLGTPNTDSTLDAFRTGKLGLGSEANPQEDLDLIGSYKSEYTYANSVISRLAFGGENIASEVGFPTGSIKGQAYTVFPAAGTQEDTDGMVSQILQADLSAVGAPPLISQVGFSNSTGTRYAHLISRKNNLNNYYNTGLQVFNSTDGNTGWIRLEERGQSVGYDLEPLGSMRIEGGTSGVISNTFQSPHEFSTNAGVVALVSYAAGRPEGFVNTDNVAATGTAATVLGTPVYALNVDINGNIVTTPVVLSVHADNAAAIAAGLSIGNFYRTGDFVKVVH